MANLGSFGAALKELDPNGQKDTFTYFGQEFTIIGVLPPMLMFQLAAAMTGKVDETEGMGAMWEAFRTALGDSEFNRLYRIAVDNKDATEDLMRLVMAIYENDTGRPTEQPSDSSAGLSSTSTSSSPSVSTPPASGVEAFVQDRSIPHLVPVSQVLAG